jgi:pimeloyl-ACP methyl ester carboxylesterase
MSKYVKGDLCLAYEVHGEGVPILLIAPGGLRSERGMWSNSPIDPVATLSPYFQVISMDQRNAGASSGPIEADHSWQTYTQDQLDLMDYLGHRRFAVVGMCIGGPYILNLIKTAPERVLASTVLQTIGRDDNRQAFLSMFDGWADDLHQGDPETFPASALADQRRHMFENDLTFLCMTEQEVAQGTAPMLIMDGADTYHPASSSQRLAELQPQAERLTQWKQPPDTEQAASHMLNFFQSHVG